MQEMGILLAYFRDWPGYSVINDEINLNKVCLIYKCLLVPYMYAHKGTTVVCMISQLTVSITTMKLKVEEHYFCISAIKLWHSVPVGIRSSSSIKSFTLTN